jgi:hypothetical protein
MAKLSVRLYRLGHIPDLADQLQLVQATDPSAV